MIGFIAASAVFVYQNISNVVTALRTGMVTIGSTQVLGMGLSVGCKIDQVKVLHQKLQTIVDQAAEGICTFYVANEIKIRIFSFFAWFFQMVSII